MTKRKADTWMPLYIADYLRDTMHLSRDQHGGYLLLLMACWDRGGRLPNDPAQLAGIAKATPTEWRRLAAVLLPFFQVDGADLVHKRVLAEHQKAAKLSETRTKVSAKGVEAREQKRHQTTTKQEPIGSPNDDQLVHQTGNPGSTHQEGDGGYTCSSPDTGVPYQEISSEGSGLGSEAEVIPLEGRRR